MKTRGRLRAAPFLLVDCGRPAQGVWVGQSCFFESAEVVRQVSTVSCTSALRLPRSPMILTVVVQSAPGVSSLAQIRAVSWQVVQLV